MRGYGFKTTLKESYNRPPCISSSCSESKITLVNHYVDLRCLRRFYGDSYADLLEKNGGAHEVNTENNW